MSNLPVPLQHLALVHVRQRKELAELFGWEGRNKYELTDPAGVQIAFAVEQRAVGLLGVLGRQLLGHWRRFDLTFYDEERRPLFRADHPFQWILGRLDILAVDETPLGRLQQRFGILTRAFDLLDLQGHVLLEMRAKIWKPWTFPIYRHGQEVARIEKRWSGALKEVFTDTDNFTIRFHGGGFSEEERRGILAMALLIDLTWFEHKAD